MTVFDDDHARTELQALYRRESNTVYGFLVARCGSRHLAEDLTSETFINAADRFAQGRSQEVTGAWLITAARRRLVDHWRRSASQRSRRENLQRELGVVPPASSEVPDDPDHERVGVALASLPDRQRAALSMRYLDEMSVSEVADVLGLSYQAGESLLARARRSFVVAFEASIR